MCSTEPAIHVGDIGTLFIVTILDESGDIVNLTAATELEITFKNSRGQNLVVAMPDVSLYTDGLDGKIKYTTVSGDIPYAGTYYIQGRIVTLNTEYHSTIDSFTVEANL